MGLLYDYGLVKSHDRRHSSCMIEFAHTMYYNMYDNTYDYMWILLRGDGNANETGTRVQR